MELRAALRLDEYPRLALVGAGGKSSALFQLAREYPTPLIVTASTHLALEQVQFADQHILIQRIEDTNQLYEISLSGVILLTGPISGDRTTGLPEKILPWVHDFCGYYSMPLLIEADGARRLPLKAPAEHEPLIPSFVKTVVVVAGLSGLGKPLTVENVHRPERFARLSGLAIGDLVTPESLAAVLTHPQGGLKNIPAKARRIAMLTQAETAVLEKAAYDLAKRIMPIYDSVITTAFSPKNQPAPPATHQPRLSTHHPLSIHEPIAGIILAAGESRRFGSPKQLLPWRGKAFVWHVAKTALDAGLSPVIVVTGANHREVEAAVSDLPVEIVHNAEWAAGQGESVRAGVKRVPSNSGGAIFLLADQPQIPVALLRKIVDAHAQTLSPIAAPWVTGKRANPVLFDRQLFSRLETLSGDSGGRQLFSAFPHEKVQWDHADILLDVDTPEDYDRLLTVLNIG